MAAKKSGRAGGIPPARPNTEREETNVMPSYGNRTQTHTEGATVIGEPVRRIRSESAEVTTESTTAAPTAAQAIPAHHTRPLRLPPALTPLGAHHGAAHPNSPELHT